MVFSGITSAGCHAAVEFMTSPQCLHVFLDRIEAEGYKSYPQSYQIVIRAGTTSETLLINADYETQP